MKFYSKTTDSFYIQEIHGDNKPNDCIEITDTHWQELIDGRSMGKLISTDSAGIPFLIDPPPISNDELNKIAEYSRQQAFITESDPLFFKAERGEIDKQVWLDKVAEIKTRYPKL
jgi:hypothetical protein